jgi:hypothetical protein
MAEGKNEGVELSRASRPIQSALPSQDGDYWIFYRQGKDGFQSGVYCSLCRWNFELGQLR